MTAAIADLLARLESPGSFASRRGAPADDLDVEVKGVGRLRYPITARMAQKLRQAARPSPFGLRDQTLHDRAVRNSWEVAASRVKISASRWKPALAQHLAAFQRELGVAEGCKLRAVLDKLLVYEPGSFFKPHQDSEKSDDMLGTLVVVLPSEYRGGALTVEHRGRKARFARLKSQSTELSLLAFYADCRHEISKVTAGYRVALTYRLLLDRPRNGHQPKGHGSLALRLADSVREHFSVPVARNNQDTEPAPPERLVYLLDHEYTQHSLSWSRLKNGDRLRVAALQQAASSLDCEQYLALAEVHECWSCEDDDEYDRFGHRYWRAHAERDSDPESYELLGLEDSSVELHHWLDARGKRVTATRSPVDGAELCLNTPSADLNPYRSEHEGYQGNYGNTVDRWYRRAAFVMWPRSNSFTLAARVRPKWAIEQLLAIPPAHTAELEGKVAALLPRWNATLRGVERSDTRLFADLSKLATRIADAELARRWLFPLGVERLLRSTIRRSFVQLVATHGASWAQGLFEQWAEPSYWDAPKWLAALAALCEELCATEQAGCKEFARWLLKREGAAVLERCRRAVQQQSVWLELEAFEDEAKHLSHVLAAAVAMGDVDVLERTTNLLLDPQPQVPLSFLQRALRTSLARSPALENQLLGSPLHVACVERLQAALSAKPRAAGDWSIQHHPKCRCSDCQELDAFLRSGQRHRDWPLSKERRQHIHSSIDSAGLPVTHETLRRGRPHVLQLRKTEALFSREAQFRKQLQHISRAVPALPPARARRSRRR